MAIYFERYTTKLSQTSHIPVYDFESQRVVLRCTAMISL